MNELELKKFKARNIQGRMKHLSNQLEYLKVNLDEWNKFKPIINMKINHLITDSISLGSEGAASYLALMQDQLNESFNIETIKIMKDQLDEVLEALDSIGVEILINDQQQSGFAH